jgi:hypothetical protein
MAEERKPIAFVENPMDAPRPSRIFWAPRDFMVPPGAKVPIYDEGDLGAFGTGYVITRPGGYDEVVEAAGPAEVEAPKPPKSTAQGTKKK